MIHDLLLVWVGVFVGALASRVRKAPIEFILVLRLGILVLWITGTTAH